MVSSVRKSFENQNLFITGASGFIGKVLLEHLLRCCYDLGRIYVLMRSKRGLNVQQRLEKIFEEPLYDRLKRERPNFHTKIVAILGDMRQLNLGISEDDLQTLKENVSIVINSAASVRFDQPLQEAIIINTRAVNELINMMTKFKHLKVFLHVSTTYAFCDRKVIEEKIYPPKANWKKFIELAEHCDRHLLDVLTTKCISPLPNTYTFTKSLGEAVVVDMCSGSIPAIILRPSIVSNTLETPFTGWADNFNGPLGLFVLGAKGIMSILYGDVNVQPDVIPVDMVAKTIIMAIWQKDICSNPDDKYKIDICNCSSHGYIHFSWKEVFDGLTRSGIPLKAIWRENLTFTKNYYFYYISLMCSDVVRALFFDVFLRLKGKKPRLLQIQRKLFNAISSLEYFLQNEWLMRNDSMHKMERMLKLSNDLDFTFMSDDFEVIKDRIMYDAQMGMRKYLLREDTSPKAIEEDIAHVKRLEIIGKIFDIAYYVAILWIVYKLQLVHSVLYLLKRLLIPFVGKLLVDY